ncbi:MAG: TM2 domain-containing protein [Cytophagales bacterium]|nr:TM2 domain-containing protein [Cytophagales bacterium]
MSTDQKRGSREDHRPKEEEVSRHSYIVTLLLCFFIGGWGIHRMYVGKVGTGILLFLLSSGGLTLWLLSLVGVVGGAVDGSLDDESYSEGLSSMIGFAIFLGACSAVTVLIDFIKICIKKFKDKYGLVVSV